MTAITVSGQTRAFAAALLHGVTLGFLYDLLRAMRRAFPGGIVRVSVEDFLFSLLSGMLTFFVLFTQTHGILRGYMAAGVILGILFYERVPGRILLPCYSRILIRIRKICRIVRKRIEFRVKRRYNIRRQRFRAFRNRHKG